MWRVIGWERKKRSMQAVLGAVLADELLGEVQVPEFRVSYTITTDKFDVLYKKLKPKGVTLTALLAKACGVALASHPLLYACALPTLRSAFSLLL